MTCIQAQVVVNYYPQQPDTWKEIMVICVSVRSYLSIVSSIDFH